MKDFIIHNKFEIIIYYTNVLHYKAKDLSTFVMVIEIYKVLKGTSGVKL